MSKVDECHHPLNYLCMLKRIVGLSRAVDPVRSVLISLVVVSTYLIAWRAIGLADSDSVREVLKLLVSFSALVTTVIYAVLIPVLFSEKDKKSQLISKFKADCMKIYFVQNFCFQVAHLILNFNSFKTSFFELYQMLYDKDPIQLVGCRGFFYEKEFYDTIERIMFSKEQPEDSKEAVLYHHIKSVFSDDVSRRLFMLQNYLYEFVWPAGKTFRIPVTECVFSPEQIQHLRFSAFGINHSAYFNTNISSEKAPPIVSVSISKMYLSNPTVAMNVHQGDINRYKKLALEGVYTTRNYDFLHLKIFLSINFQMIYMMCLVFIMQKLMN